MRVCMSCRPWRVKRTRAEEDKSRTKPDPYSFGLPSDSEDDSPLAAPMRELPKLADMVRNFTSL